MKKLFFIMAMSVCAFTAQAQTTSGIRVGLNMTSATGKYNDLMADQDYNNKSYMGYSIHYFIDVPVIGNFSIQPAVGLSMKGITYEYDKFTLKSATKLFSVLLASKRPLITELADKLRLKYPLLPTISPCPTMRLEAIRSIIPISCRRYPKSV